MKAQPIKHICEFLGKKPSEAKQLIEDGLPVIKVPAKTKHSSKVLISALHAWLAANSRSYTITYEELLQDYQHFLDNRNTCTQ